MSTDVEMNAVNSSLLDDQKVDQPSDAPAAKEIEIPDFEVKDGKSDHQEFTGLTKEELKQFAKDPFWRKLRLGLFIVFWIIWFAMLVSAICIVVFSKKCPERPKLQFWQKNVGYWVDPFAFSDTDGNAIGDLNGLIGKLDYIKNELGAKYIILDSIFKGQVTNKKNKFGLVESFDELDDALGDRKNLVKLVKAAKKKGIDIVMSIDINSLTKTSNYFGNKIIWTRKTENDMKTWVDRNSKLVKDPYSSLGDKTDIDLTKKDVMDKIKGSLKSYLKDGIMGFLMTNVPVYVENTTAAVTKIKYGTNSLVWFSEAKVGTQIFAQGTKTILKEIRELINSVTKTTDRAKVLIADVGKVGLGLRKDQKDEMIQYLDKNIGVDMVISREFLKNRGNWLNVNEVSTVEGYVNSTESALYNKMALTSATSVYERPKDYDTYRSIVPFLLPGNPIVYYGSELNLLCFSVVTNHVYPKNLIFDNVKRCNHLPMCWNNEENGGFSNISQPGYCGKINSLNILTAVGRGTTIFQIYKNLIKLRSKESMLWGGFEFIEQPKSNKMDISEIFKREAKGFKPFIVAIVSSSYSIGRSISFKSVCKESNKLKTVFMYPENTKLKINEVVAADNIYLKMDRKPSFYVFECV